jgi:integrase
VRALGFANEALGEDPVKAARRARELNELVEAERLRRRGVRRDAAPGSLAQLIDRYERSPQFAALEESTRKDRKNILRRIGRKHGATEVASITRADLVDFYEGLIQATTLSMANAVMRTYRVLLGYAADRGAIPASPADGIKLVGVAARRQVWTDADRDAFQKAAIAAGRRSIALAAQLAWDLGQRAGDVRRLTWGQFDGASISLTQAKTGTSVRVELAFPMTLEMLAQTPRTGVQIVVSEATGRPYAKHFFSHEVARIRALAKLPTTLQFRDLRRSALTDMGRAGATDDELRAASGHKSRAVVGIYVVPSGESAARAQRKRTRNTEQL